GGSRGCLRPACAARRSLPSFPTRRSSDLLSPAALLCQPRCAQTLEFIGGRAQKFRQRRAHCDVSCFRESPCERAVNSARISRSRSEEHTSELQSRFDLVCRLLLETKKNAG